jgi:prepilin-type N-terminal cleavage/methylation domain-containing protein/prepilin-type processing-associated H-X9-DG protein
LSTDVGQLSASNVSLDRMKRFTSSKPGFTVLELLVVIGILAVLATLTGSALGHATARAAKAQCSSNLKQLGLGLHMYLADHHSYPYGNVERFLTAGLGDRPDWSPGILACPTTRGWSYLINGYGSKGWEDDVSLGLCPDLSGEPVAEGQVVSPAEMIAVHDPVHVNMPLKRSPETATLVATHGSMANYLFCDGGVRPYSIRKDRTMTDSWRRMWNRDNQSHAEDW